MSLSIFGLFRNITQESKTNPKPQPISTIELLCIHWAIIKNIEKYATISTIARR
jgi:hypothetical protein